MLWGWLDDRTGLRDFVHECSDRAHSRWQPLALRVGQHARIRLHRAGHHRHLSVDELQPQRQTAWESVYYIQHQTSGGWLLRGIHHFMAQAMVVLMGLHLMQVVIDGAYCAPREVNFWLGLVLMQIVLGLSLTGYLLPWDQKGYWATRVATNLLSLVPAVGPYLQQLVVGGSDYGHHTLTRFFALHAGVLPVRSCCFSCCMWRCFVATASATSNRPSARRHVLARPGAQGRRRVPGGADRRAGDDRAHPIKLFSGSEGEPLSVSHLGAELGAPADPSNQYSAARPEWYFLFLFQFLKLFEGWGERGELLGAIVIPSLVLLALALMPLIGAGSLAIGSISD